MRLQDIGRKHNTDKHDGVHSFNGISYLDNYEAHFSPYQNNSINLLEIGVLNGASLHTWRDYFPNGIIYGLDIDPSRKSQASERVIINIGSQNDIEFLKTTYYDIMFDFIVDDGSHVNEFTLNSFNYLFYHHLKPGGIYIIEDLLCSYEPAPKNIWPGMQYNQEPTQQGDSYINNRNDMDQFFLKIINGLDHKNGEIQSIHFYSMMAVIYKKQ